MTVIILPSQRPPGRRGFEVVLPSAATDGATALVEGRVPAAMAGPPLHVHRVSDESYYVVSGALVMYIDGTVTELPPGGVAHISRETEHTWATPPGSPAHFLTLHSPAGYERYHASALQLEEELGQSPTASDLLELSRRFDWELCGEVARRLLPTGVLIEASRADAEAAKSATGK